MREIGCLGYNGEPPEVSVPGFSARPASLAGLFRRFRACVLLDGDGFCTDYDARPALCRNYPTKSLYYQGGLTLDGCGYAFRAVTFRDVLLGRKPFKPADFSAVPRRGVEQEQDKLT